MKATHSVWWLDGCLRTHQNFGSLLLVVLVATASANALGNPIAEAAADLQSGQLQFRFPARDGVQGNGDNVSISTGSGTVWRHKQDDSRRDWCEVCDIWVTLTVREGEVRKLRWWIGDRSRDDRNDLVDLGAVEASLARDFLLQTVEQSDARVAKKALEAAVLSEATVPWRQLLTLARDRSKDESLRSTALFWLGREAQEAVTIELEGVVADELEDLNVRKAAVFALSQRPESESIPSLKRIALQHRSMQLRQNALFWLAQSNTPEVVDFFEAILAGAEER